MDVFSFMVVRGGISERNHGRPRPPSAHPTIANAGGDSNGHRDGDGDNSAGTDAADQPDDAGR